MTEQDDLEFQALMVGVRAGDPDAAAELVRLYEPEIRREVRLRLTSPQLRRTLDSVDICQSVFGKFFIKAALGDLEFDRPQHLLRLLCQMARNKVIDRHRRDQVRQPAHGGSRVDLSDVDPPDRGESASQIIERKELLTRMSDQLTEQEQRIAVLRRNGESWPEIARQTGGTVEGSRKMLARACERVMHELGIET